MDYNVPMVGFEPDSVIKQRFYRPSQLSDVGASALIIFVSPSRFELDSRDFQSLASTDVLL